MSTGWVNGLAAEKAKGFGGYETEYGCSHHAWDCIRRQTGKRSAEEAAPAHILQCVILCEDVENF